MYREKKIKNDPFRLHELDDDEFAALSAQICIQILGTATVVFAPGKDGGRDAAFEGTANAFPSSTRPANGKFVIQAKHTAEPYCSTRDSAFKSLWKKEVPKIASLATSNECDVYLLFTNRRCPAKHKAELKLQIKQSGVKSCEIFCIDTINLHLSKNPDIVKACGLNRYKPPFRINSDELAELVQDFHGVILSPAINDSLYNLRYVDIDNKNKINALSSEYFTYIQSSSMPYFSQIRTFLENPRNSNLREQYHTSADEIAGKVVTFRGDFVRFEEVFVSLYDMLTSQSSLLKSKRRLLNIFLHYMYCDCDIGKQHA